MTRVISSLHAWAPAQASWLTDRSTPRRRIPSTPSIRHVSENNTGQGFFERPDFEALVTTLPDYLKDFTRFAYLTGWRKGEIISLRWADVDRDGGVIRLRPEASKNAKGRSVVLDGELDALIERRRKARLVERNGKPHVTDLVFHRDGAWPRPFRIFKLPCAPTLASNSVVCGPPAPLRIWLLKPSTPSDGER